MLHLDYIEQGLSSSVSFSEMKEAVHGPLRKMMDVVNETIDTSRGSNLNSSISPAAQQSHPIIRQVIAEQIGDIKIVDGDHFGSVANGLTLWAQQIYR